MTAANGGQAIRLYEFAKDTLFRNPTCLEALQAAEEIVPGTVNDVIGNIAAGFSLIIGTAVQHPEWAAGWDQYARTVVKRLQGSEEPMDIEIANLVERLWFRAETVESEAAS